MRSIGGVFSDYLAALAAGLAKGGSNIDISINEI
jgi:hypothetical protein